MNRKIPDPLERYEAARDRLVAAIVKECGLTEKQAKAHVRALFGFGYPRGLGPTARPESRSEPGQAPPAP